MSNNRPELQAPPEFYYNSLEASKYTRSSRNAHIQDSMTRRALELLLLPDKPCMLLDIGCGSCLSSAVLTEEGHQWIGVDISKDMLEIAHQNVSPEDGDLILADIGQNIRFKPGIFDGCIGISVLQWLCNADRSSHNPFQRLTTFFRWLYSSLSGGARAAFQFYPHSAEQIELITSAALRSGFGGGLIVDFPNSTKAKKYYLCLWAGFSGAPPQLPKALDDAGKQPSDTVLNSSKERHTKKPLKNRVKTRDWILKKKQRQRKLGKEVRPDTKYTGRKRKDRF